MSRIRSTVLYYICKTKLFRKPSLKYNKWLKENGFPTISNYRIIPDFPYLNLYGYPEELDYTDMRPMPEKWFRMEAFIRKGEEEFKLPKRLRGSNGKRSQLVYLSLGSMGSIDVELMKRLVEILSKFEHKFIDQFDNAQRIDEKGVRHWTRPLHLY